MPVCRAYAPGTGIVPRLTGARSARHAPCKTYGLTPPSSFSVRARRDWNDYSDIDLMLVGADTTRRVSAYLPPAYRVARREYGAEPPAIDVKCLSRQDFQEQVTYSRNRIGAVAYREGIIMDGYAPPPNEPESTARNPENSERAEMEERLMDAHIEYDEMHVLLDRKRYTKGSMHKAHQALERGLKALIVAQERDYPHSHDLTSLARDCGLDLRSDLQLLSEYAGGPRHGAPPFPALDFIRIANDVTDDLSAIFQRVYELTGMNPWAMENVSGPDRRTASPQQDAE